MRHAACIGHEWLFFGSPDPDNPRKENGRRRRIALAKAMCNTCPVRPDCLDWALRVNQEDGVAGGLTQTERRRILRRRNQ